jgi:type VI secretion system protein ImpL
MLALFKPLATRNVLVPLCCLMLAIAMICFIGPYVAIAGVTPLLSWVARIVTCVFILLCFALYKTIQHILSLKNEEKLVEEISTQDDAEQLIDAEYQALKDKFKSAFTLRQRSKNKTLIDIPWYMIIGSPGAGKTTLLSNSGLRFPLAEKLDTKALQGVGGTKNCDWWITQDAVLLDTAGRYTSQDSYKKVDESGWQHFLQLIKRYRKKPLSGVIVSISLSDLLHLNEYELTKHLDQLKQRVSEVNIAFDARLPIYIVMTKTDLLAGFSEFFETFSHKEREQILGFTFDPQTSLSAFSEDGALGQEFIAKYGALCKSLARRKWARMAIERDHKKKSMLYLFSEQFGLLQPAIKQVIEQLSRVEDGIQSSIVRGCYFTSGTQTGSPINRIVTRVAQVTGMAATHQTLWNNDQRSYFIKDCLERVILSEEDRFSSLYGYAKKQSRIKTACLFVFSLVGVVFCLGLSLSYKNNLDYLSVAEANIKQWETRYSSSLSSDSIFSSAKLNEQLKALHTFSANERGLGDLLNQRFAGLGLNQHQSLENGLQASYRRLLKRILLPFIQQQLERDLLDESDTTRQYQALKSYLMMSNSKRRNPPFIQTFLVESINRNNLFSAADHELLRLHIQRLVEMNMEFDSVDESKIEVARKHLSRQQLSDIYYQQFKSEQLRSNRHSESGRFLSMAQLAGPNWRSVFKYTQDDVNAISDFYTPDAFNSLFKQGIDQFVKHLSKEPWVLGDEHVIDEKQLKQDISNLYVRDYINQWRALIDRIHIRSFSTSVALSNSIQTLSQHDSPLFILLNNISRATDLSVPSDRLVNSQAITNRAPKTVSDFASTLSSHSPRNTVSSNFETLHKALKPERKQSTEQSLVTLLQDLNIALSFQIQASSDNFTPLSTKNLQGFGYVQISPLKRWINELSGQIDRLQFTLQKQHLNTLWINATAQQCVSITENTYPFNSRSMVDASLADITQLFGQSGAISQYFNTHFSQLINQQVSPWTWKNGVQEKYAFRNDILRFFEQVRTIQNSLFSATNSTPRISFTLTPVYLDNTLARVSMTIYGKQLNYQFGRPTPQQITWPPVNNSVSSEIRFVRRDNSEISVSQEGIFSLMRLIQNADVKRVSNSKVEVGVTYSDYSMLFELSVASPGDPLMLNQLREFSCLPSLL